MRIQILGLTLFLVVLVVATCATNQSGNANRTVSSFDSQASPTPVPETVNRVFDVTPQNVRGAFEDGRRLRTDPKFGQEQSVDVTAQVLTGTETLKLTITFLSPLNLARRAGFHRRGESPPRPDDTELTTIFQNRSQVDFRVRLQQPRRDTQPNLPTLSYALLDKDGNPISLTDKPVTETLIDNRENHDLLQAFEPEGLPLVFPVFNNAIPNLTNRMDTMVLIVKVDSDEHRLQFRLQ